MNRRQSFFLWIYIALIGFSISFCTPNGSGGLAGSPCTQNSDCDASANLECRAKKCRVRLEKRPPIARAEHNPESPEVNQKVELDGKGSVEPQLEPLQYKWSIQGKPEKSAIKITNSNQAIASFIPDLPGDYAFRLEVSAGPKEKPRKHSAVLAVHVIDRVNTAPIANAGSDQLIEPNTTVKLDGTESFDADADKLSYKWTFKSQPTGSTAKLNDPTSDKPTFKGIVLGDYILELVVTDTRGRSSSPDNVTIRVLEGASKKPVLTSASPLKGEAYELSFQVTLNGSDFFKGAKVLLGSQEFAATYVSATQLTSKLNLARLGPGKHPLRVINPNGLRSESIDFTVTSIPAPQLQSLSPPSGHIGGKLTVIARGKNFIQSRSEVLFQSVPLPTKVLSPTELEFQLDLKNTSLGSYPITIKNPGNLVSNKLDFQVRDKLPKPVLRVVNPPAANIGTTIAFSVHGQGFGVGSVIVFNGKDLKTKRIQGDELQADPNLDLKGLKEGTYEVWVRNPDGQISSKESFRIRSIDPSPKLSRILPFNLYLNEVMVDVAIYGQDIVKGAKLFIGKHEITGALGKVVFRSETFLLAEINLKDKSIWTTPGNLDAVVQNPNGKKSNPFSITVTHRQPSVTNLIPSSWSTQCDTNVEVHGSNFVKSVHVKLGALTFSTTSTTHPLQYVSSQLLKFNLQSTKLMAGKLKVAIENGPHASTTAPDFELISGKSLTPHIRYARPSFARADTKFTLRVNPDRSAPDGSRSFKPGAVVEINGIKQPTTCQGSSHCWSLEATVDLTGFKPGDYDLRVINPCDVKSTPITFTVAPAPTPLLSSVEPAYSRIGDKTKIKFLGEHFSKSHTLTWNGKIIPTVYVSGKEIETKDPIDFSSATLGSIKFQITHTNGQKTVEHHYSILNRYAPTIDKITENVQEKDSILNDMVVTGKGFTITSVAYLNGNRISSRFISPTEVRIVGLDSSVLSPGAYKLQIKNGHRGSNIYPIFIKPTPKPVADYSDPSKIVAGSKTTITLYVYGSLFDRTFPSKATLIFKDPSGKDLTAARWTVAYASTSFMRGTLNVAGLNAGKYTFQVKNPQGGLSNPIIFNISPPPPPTITGISPVQVFRGVPQSVQIQGTNFVNGDMIIFNNNVLNRIPGVALSSSTLTASIDLRPIRRSGSYEVYVLRCLDTQCTKTTQTKPTQLQVKDPPCSAVDCTKDLPNAEKCDTASTPQVCRPTCTKDADCTALDAKATWTCQTGVCK